MIKNFTIFLRFIFSRFPLAYVCLIAMIAGVIVEYVALSVMVPLSDRAENNSALLGANLISAWWNSVASFFDFPINPKTWFWVFILVLGIRVLIALFQVVINSYISKKIHAQLSSSTYKNVVEDVPMSVIYRHSVGYYMGLAGDDSIRVGQLFYSVLQTIGALLSALIGLLILYFFSEQIFALTVLFLIICGLFLGALIGRLIRLSKDSSILGKEASTIFIESLNGLRSIRTMGGEQYVGGKYGQVVSSYARSLFFIDFFNHSARTVPGLILLAGALFYLYPESRFYDEVSIVYLFAVTALIVRVLSFLSVAVFSAGKAATEMRAVFDLEEILKVDKMPFIAESIKNIKRIEKIKLTDLGCGYSNDSVLINNINVELVAGNSYALMGESGSGKSTFCDILLGLMPPLSGDMFIDGISYSNLDMSKLREKAILIEQQTRIFSGSIRENISFGLNVTDGEINQAINNAGLEDFISSLPMGIETILEYQGSNLSGGQCQRLGIARALLRNPDLLILDEATSALDVSTRNVLVQNLLKLFATKILIFVTHDPHVASCVDQLWKIQKSHLIVEKIK